jgi:signal transduction histidine kinase
MIAKLWPKSLVGQLVVAIALALFVAQAVNFVMLARSQNQRLIAHGSGMIVARIVDAVERERRGGGARDERQLVREDGRRDGWRAAEQAMRLRITNAPVAVPQNAELVPDVGSFVAARLAEADVQVRGVTAWAIPMPAEVAPYDVRGRVLYVTAQVGEQYYTARGRLPESSGRWQGFVFWQTLTFYLLLLGPIMWIAWRAAKPLRLLTQAVRTPPLMRGQEPVAEAGPSDVRELTRAFNMYRARIDRMLSDKDRMLGAVGHDLRTPLASLRVRVEQVEDDRLRDKMIASIEEMTAMLTDILALARAGAGTEKAEIVSAKAVMQDLTDDFREQGRDVTLAAVEDVEVAVRPLLLRRALRNLISNAVAYGERARLSVRVVEGQAEFVISDDGAGLSDAQIIDLIEPFARGEASRNRATGGSGLGLSIARDIAEGEGGALMLRRRDEGGLDAILRLPLLV